MKKLIIIALTFLFFDGKAQQIIANDNTLSATIDGKEFKTQPRRIKIGAYYWVTANTISPDKSFRIWFVDFTKNDAMPEVGKYLLVDENHSASKSIDKIGKDRMYKGVAIVKYVEETKTPRMEYHVGKSLQDEISVIEVTSNKNGFLEGTFSVNLEGTYWKERVSATVFGGGGRLLDKFKDKAKTSATGFDQDIDPEGNGYKKQDKKDQIMISNGKFKLKFAEAK
jgi:hypothetical protein